MNDLNYEVSNYEILNLLKNQSMTRIQLLCNLTKKRVNTSDFNEKVIKAYLGISPFLSDALSKLLESKKIQLKNKIYKITGE